MQGVIVVLAVNNMDSPPTYAASEAVVIGDPKSYSSVSLSGYLLALSTPFGTELHLLPYGTVSVEINVPGCPPTEIEIKIKKGVTSPTESRVSCQLCHSVSSHAENAYFRAEWCGGRTLLWHGNMVLSSVRHL